MRWQYPQAPAPANKIPASLVRLSETQKHAVVVDMGMSRLFLYRNNNGRPELIRDFYVTIGKNGTRKHTEGDQKTPVGVYFVTGFIDREKLPDLYGAGAFPIDYPNVWDKRHGRTGYGIWLHGTPSYTFNRPPRDSDGCLILSNQDFLAIAPYLANDTPFVMAETIEWINEKEWLQQQSRYTGLIDEWRQDWESRDADTYLEHYSRDYAGLGMDYLNFVSYKRQVNSSKEYIKVGLSERSIFLYPGEENLIIVTFRQKYESDNATRNFVKRQYWRLEKDGRWKIIYEGSAS
jgi:murein L,D-transpeptidase YafK